MTDEDKTLPKDTADYSLPGRLEESNNDFFAPSESQLPPEPKPKPKNKVIIAAAVIFVVVSAGFFSYYFANQNEIDSQILQNTYNLTPEEQLAIQYGVGEYGSDHAHAAIAVFINGEKLNFAHPQFQLTSKYIHFENHNPYLIHKHATNVPLEMLFSSFGMEVTPDCIILHDAIDTNSFCASADQSLDFYVNGKKFSEISQYVLGHNDRILISYGNQNSIPDYLEYLDTLKIFDIPKRTLPDSGNDISI